MQETQTMLIGEVVKAQGILGEVKVLPATDDAQRFHLLKQCYVKTQKECRLWQIAQVRIAPDAVYIKFADVGDRNAAELLRGAKLLIERSEAVQLDEGRYFIVDLVGCRMLDSNQNALGVLTEILQHGAADVYVIKGEKNLMVPALKALLLEVDIQARKIVLDAALLQEVAVYED